MRARSLLSTSKHSGALMSSRLIAPKVGSRAAMISTSLLRIALVDLDIEGVDAGELLEQDRLAFHDGLGRERTDRAQAEHGGAVADHADEIAARRQIGRLERILGDQLRGRGDAGGVGERQVPLVGERFGRHHRELARRRSAMVLERSVPQLVGHDGRFPNSIRRPRLRFGTNRGCPGVVSRNLSILARKRQRWRDGAVEKTRTSTPFPGQRPQRCASTNSATTACRRRRCRPIAGCLGR